MSSRDRQPEQAPLALRAKARAIDALALASAHGLYALAIRRRVHGSGLQAADIGRDAPIANMARQAAMVASERLGSPGQRIFGLRTVDARTGRPVALGRRLLLVAVESASREITARLLGSGRHAVQESRRELKAEIGALKKEHGNDGEQLNAALLELLRQRRVDGSLSPLTDLRWLPLTMAMGVASERLSRALAPTVVVAWPWRGSSG